MLALLYITNGSTLCLQSKTNEVIENRMRGEVFCNKMDAGEGEARRDVSLVFPLAVLGGD